MRPSLRPLAEQTLVVTGASRGVGLATARRAAARGARVVLVGPDADDLERVVADIRIAGGQAMAAVADVTDFEAVQRAAERAASAFGAIDSWVNAVGGRLHGRLRDVPLVDARRLFDTAYWGVVHGSLVAVSHLARRGGALITLWRADGDGHLAASQQAVRRFVDALRLEVEAAGLPVAVSRVERSAVDESSAADARPTPRAADAERAAAAILACADAPARESSLRTTASLHPMATVLGVAALGAGAALARRPRVR